MYFLSLLCQQTRYEWYDRFYTNIQCISISLYFSIQHYLPIFRFWAYLMKVILSVPDEGYFERTWWRLFWAYLMKVILSVPDEGYFERTWWRLFWVYLMKVILSVPDEGYFKRTWWRLFCSGLRKGVYNLMKVISNEPNK